jgi:hypothetical protein
MIRINLLFLLAAIAFASGCTVQNSATTAPIIVPVEKPITPITPVTLEKTCPAKGIYTAVDSSDQLTQKFLSAMRSLGINTVFRYYDMPNETIKGKTLSVSDMKLLESNGMSIGVVFQHNNSSFSSFTSARGASDGARSVELAGKLKQPAGSAIYFGVDGDWPSSSQQKAILSYFGAAAPIVVHAGYKVGIYGSGQACTTIKGGGFADYCWISDSSGFTGTAAYVAGAKWEMKQGLPKDCGGLNVDFDQVRPGVTDFGQWKGVL